ncbi:unnamed protein product, partial [Musa hybrid cultivar]
DLCCRLAFPSSVNTRLRVSSRARRLGERPVSGPGGRAITAWSGPGARLALIEIRLGRAWIESIAIDSGMIEPDETMSTPPTPISHQTPTIAAFSTAVFVSIGEQRRRRLPPTGSPSGGGASRRLPPFVYKGTYTAILDGTTCRSFYLAASLFGKLSSCSRIIKAFLPAVRLQFLPMSSFGRGRRPKKKVYHRVPELDKFVDLQKKPTLLLRLRAIIAACKDRSILLRNLEKEVGFVQKWNFLNLIQRHPTIFKVSGGSASHAPISVRLTDKAERVSIEEARARELMEPIIVTNLRKLLMMSLDCQIRLEKIELIESELGLPPDFKYRLIPMYPEFFSVRKVNGIDYLCLETWDSSLAVTAREEKLDLGHAPIRTKEIPRDGNIMGPFAFRLKFPAGFRPNKHYLEEVVKWQKMEFPSPYLSGRSVQPATPQARKRAVAILHELLSLTMEKRLTSDKLDAFHNEYQLPCRLLLCLVKNHGIFYITNKGARSTVFLKEAYDGCNLIDKCPLLKFNDSFVALIGRACLDLNNAVAA